MPKKTKSRMMPIGPLMIEHRLIERMIELVQNEVERTTEAEKVDVDFIETTVDFFRTYADRCHHGKEEDILFRDLSRKKLSAEHDKIMHELMDDHVSGRKIIGDLSDAQGKYSQGDGSAKEKITACLKQLAELYPPHIEKEDKRFFIPSMSYFNQEEQDSMLQECREFDKDFVHLLYQEKVKKIEAEKSQTSKEQAKTQAG
jgi:hemerythrin-like domain-containing protein